MLIHDASGAVAVVSAESVRIVARAASSLTPAPCTSIIRR